MPLGSFSEGGLGMGVAFTLEDHFSQTSVRIGAAMDGLESATNTMEKSINNALGKIQAGMVMVGVGLGLLAPLAAGVKAASEFEATNIAFETMLGSAEKAKQVMSEIDELAVKTPFDITQVEQGYKLLMAYQIPTNMIKDDFTALGNVAAGLNVDVDRLVRAFGQVKAKGILKGGEMLQFAEAGVDLSAMLNKVGIEFDLTKKDVADWGITFDQVRQAFRGASAAGGQFEGLMEKLSGTMKGKMANIGDYTIRIFRAIGQAIEPIVQPLVDGVLWLLQMLEAFAQTTAGKVVLAMLAGALAATGLSIAIFGLILIVKALTLAVLPLLATIAPYILAMAALAAVIALVSNASGTLETKLNNLSEAGDFTWLEKVVLFFKSLWEVLSSWDGNQFMLPAKMVEGLKKAGIYDMAMALFTWAIRIKTFFMSIWEGMKEAWGIIKPIVKWLWEGFKNTVTKVLGMFGVTLDKNKSALESWATTGKVVGYIIVGVLAAIAIAFIAMGVSSLIAMLPLLLTIGAIVLVLWGLYELVMLVIDAFNWFYDLGSKAREWGENLVKGLWEGIKNMWAEFSAWITGIFTDLWAGLVGDGPDMALSSSTDYNGNMQVMHNTEYGKRALQEDTRMRSENRYSVNQSMVGGNTQVSVPIYLDGKLISDNMVDTQEKEFYRESDN